MYAWRLAFIVQPWWRTLWRVQSENQMRSINSASWRRQRRRTNDGWMSWQPFRVMHIFLVCYTWTRFSDISSSPPSHSLFLSLSRRPAFELSSERGNDDVNVDCSTKTRDTAATSLINGLCAINPLADVIIDDAITTESCCQRRRAHCMYLWPSSSSIRTPRAIIFSSAPFLLTSSSHATAPRHRLTVLMKFSNASRGQWPLAISVNNFSFGTRGKSVIAISLYSVFPIFPSLERQCSFSRA